MKIKQLYTTDESILQGIKNSDDDAFRYLYKHGFPVIRSMILKNSGTLDDANDIFQEGIIVLYDKVTAGNFVFTCSINTFLYAVCRNLWLKALKKKSVTVSFTETHDFPNIEIETEVNENILTENQNTLVEALGKLGDPCSSILTYFYYEQFSMDTIAKMLGYTNANNAKTQKYKCLKRLKAIIERKTKVT